MEPTIKTKDEAKEIWDTLSKIDVSKFIEKKTIFKLFILGKSLDVLKN